MPLVKAVETEEICSWTIRSSRTFVGPCNSRGVIAKRRDGAVGTIDMLDQDILVGQLSSQL